MDIGEPERSGRHRLEDDEAARWLPLGGELDHAPAPHAKPVVRPDVFPVQRTCDPLVDTDAVGLRKFNIGLVPASVTPPRTWRRAAWFAVLSSAAVLVGLAYAAAKLVGADTPEDRIGMPGYPIVAPIVTGFASSTPPRPSAGVGEPDGIPVDRPDAVRATGEGRTGSTASTATPTAPGGGVGEAGDVGGVGGTQPGTSSRPTVTTVPSTAKQLVDGAAIASRTERFFEEAAANTDTALTMVSDTFRSDAEALLEQRLADVSLIRVSEISVDPATGVTVSTLHVTKKDGTTSTEKRELTFTTAGDPLINAERLLGDV